MKIKIISANNLKDLTDEELGLHRSNICAYLGVVNSEYRYRETNKIFDTISELFVKINDLKQKL